MQDSSSYRLISGAREAPSSSAEPLLDLGDSGSGVEIRRGKEKTVTPEEFVSKWDLFETLFNGDLLRFGRPVTTSDLSTRLESAGLITVASGEIDRGPDSHTKIFLHRADAIRADAEFLFQLVVDKASGQARVLVKSARSGDEMQAFLEQLFVELRSLLINY